MRSIKNNKPTKKGKGGGEEYRRVGVPKSGGSGDKKGVKSVRKGCGDLS